MSTSEPARNALPVPLVFGLSKLAANYDVILSDIWGVLHNGVEAWPSAVEALQQAKADGVKIILISNSPRPAGSVIDQLAGLGVPRSAYDDVVTSGDMTRNLMGSTYRDARVAHIGPQKDRPLVDGLSLTFTVDGDADVCLCSGLMDDLTEGPEDYRERLQGLAARGLTMVCANPDKVVEMGDKLIYCAGALADLYEELGGKVVVLGKPHPPIYEAACAMAGDPPKDRILGLGDSMRTDLRGAFEQGFDCLFLTGGIHASEFGSARNPNPARVAEFFQAAPFPAVGWMARLA